MTEKVSDFIINFFLKKQINTVFSVTGGFAMFLNNTIANSKNINVTYNHHEQACGYAAMGYTKNTLNPSIVCTTSGCGITNTISCINSCWHDNLPVFFLAGQSKTIDTIKHYKSKKIQLRNGFGSDCDIVNIVKDITKYAVEIHDIEDLEYELSKAYFLATNGRKGPVVISVPIDIQGLTIDKLNPSFIPEKQNETSNKFLNEVEKKFNDCKRPLLLIGGGIYSNCHIKPKLIKFIEKYNIPCVFTFFSMDLFESSHKLYSGRIGILGERCGNFTVQNCDLLITVGCRLNKGHTGYNPQWFAREATKIVIDIDENEPKKDLIKIDYFLKMDIEFFLDNVNFLKKDNTKWIEKCNHWKNKWFLEIPELKENNIGLNPYYLIQQVGILNQKETIYVTCSGNTITTSWHVLPIKKNDRFLVSQQGEMGFELPAGIGAAISEDKQVVVLVGDGALQFNIQELQTIVTKKLNIKIIVINNNGYCCIRNTQSNYFTNIHGCDKDSGLGFPNLEKISNAYGINYLSVRSSSDICNLKDVFENKEAYICEVFCFDQERFPKLSAVKNEDGSFTGKPFEDMKPFLTREEFNKEMIIKQL